MMSEHHHPESRITEVLERHFPGCRLWEGEQFFFSPEMLLAGGLQPLRRKDDFKELDRFGIAVTQLWDAYSALSFQAKTALGAKYKGSVDTSRHDIEPCQRIRQNLFRELVALHRAIHGRNPDRYRDIPGVSEDAGMIEAAKSSLEDLAPITKRGLTESRDQKARLVEVARHAWERYKKEAPPKKNDASPFIDFVADVIELAGKQDEEGWMPETVMKAWYTYDRS